MRQFIRHPTDIPIEYTIGESIAYSNEYLKNISRGGLCFCVDVNIEPGFAILIRIPICMPVFKAKGFVVWCHKTKEKYEVGVKFADTGTEFSVRNVEQICYIEEYKKKVLKKEGRKLSGEEAAMEWIEKYAKDFPR